MDWTSNVDVDSVNLRDPHWRVTPLGWFSDDEKLLEPGRNNEGRFHCISDQELDSLAVAKPPVNTVYSTKWVVRNFTDWMQHRNIGSDNSTPRKVPNNLLDGCSADDPLPTAHWSSLPRPFH